MKRERFFAGFQRAMGVLLVTFLLGAKPACAQQRIEIIVTITAGAPDMIARVIADVLREKNYEVTVRNVLGANGEIGLRALIQAPTSRPTLLVAANSLLSINPHIYGRAEKDPWSTIQPVLFIGRNTSNFVLLRSDSRFETISELIKSKTVDGAAVKYGTNGVGSLYHLVFEEIFTKLHARDRVHIPYKSNSEGVQALLAGDIDILISGLSALPLVESRRLKAIAVLGHRPSPLYPDVPALSRQLNISADAPWFALLGNRSLSPARVRELHQIVSAGLRSEAHRERLSAFGIDVQNMDEKEFLLEFGKEYDHFQNAVRKLNIKND